MKNSYQLSLLQNGLSSPNASIGDMVFKVMRNRFPLRNSAGMTEFGLLQEAKLSVISYKGIIFCLLITVHCLLLTASFAQDSIKESLSDLNRILPSKKVVNLSWGRDPFVPLTGDGLGKPGNLKLTAIIYNAKKPSAIVNNKIIFVGDSVGGQKVIDITKQYVILRGIGGSYKLEIGNPAGESYDIKKTQ